MVRCAIVGATGLVGSTFLKVLEQKKLIGFQRNITIRLQPYKKFLRTCQEWITQKR